MATVIYGVPLGNAFFDTSGRIWQEPIVGGTNSRRWLPEWTVQTSLGGNANVWKIFYCPTAPVATLKANVYHVANAATGNARLNLSWAAGNVGTNFDTVTLSSETVQTISWATGNEYDMLNTKITLDATTAPTAGQLLFLQMGFETASWTLAQKSYWSVHLIDE
jgi:hypothetical protein